VLFDFASVTTCAPVAFVTADKQKIQDQMRSVMSANVLMLTPTV
jgi:hypothetical protein